jgi:hypothetical protein
VREAREGFCKSAESRPIKVRTELSEAGHSQKDNTWVYTSEIIVSQTPLLHTTWAEALNDNVAPGYQSTDDFTIGLKIEVECNQPLVAGDDFPPEWDFIPR